MLPVTKTPINLLLVLISLTFFPIDGHSEPFEASLLFSNDIHGELASCG